MLGAVGVVGAYAFARNGISWPFTAARPGANTPTVIRSIAVLPLDNYSGDSTQEYFAEGMTDELTADLATIQPASRDLARAGEAVQGRASAADA